MPTYQAPGVYVEEVPSAQQPIAGVGTNTVGFIGVVPDTIEYPKPNPDYDPVLAQLVLEVSQILTKGEKAEKDDLDKLKEDKDALRQRIQDMTNQNQELKKKLDEANTTLANSNKELDNVNAEIARLEALPDDDPAKGDLGNKKKEQKNCSNLVIKTNKEIDEYQNQIDTNNETITQIQNTLDNKTDAKPASAVERKASHLCPYVLDTFTVAAKVGDTKFCTNFSEYAKLFGPFSAYREEKGMTNLALHPDHQALTHAVYGFFLNGGTRCFVCRVTKEADIESAMLKFESIEGIAIVASPAHTTQTLQDLQNRWSVLAAHCEKCEDRFAILDSPVLVRADDNEQYYDLAVDEKADDSLLTDDRLEIKLLGYDNLNNVLPQRNKNSAYYFPWIEVSDPAKMLQDQDPARNVPSKYRGRVHVAPSGHIAGIYARTDEQRGVHKAPANAPVLGAMNVRYYIGKPKQANLNPQGVNVIRNLDGNITVWGARTVGGELNTEWKYVNVRRLFLFLRDSIDQGTQWVVFEPNDRALWEKIRRNIGDFLRTVWRSGALFGSTPEEAFYVKCDDETNPPEERELGRVITEIGVAIVRPAEFVIFRITQASGGKNS